MRRILTLTPIALMLAACGGGGGSSSDSGPGTGTFSLGITDAPVDDALEVNIVITGVTLKPQDSGQLEYTFDSPRMINLLDLQGSLSEPLLVNEEIPAGNYNWIRLAVDAELDGSTDDSHIILEENGGMYELRVPSGSQTGLQLNTGFTIAQGSANNFTVDFDLRKSIVEPPGLGVTEQAYLLKPTLRLIDNLVVGTITGTISNDLYVSACGIGTANPVSESATNYGAVYLYTDDYLNPPPPAEGDPVLPVLEASATAGPLTTALVKEDGGSYSYEIGFVEEGDYGLYYTCYNEFDRPDNVTEGDQADPDSMEFVGPVEVTVTAGDPVMANFPPES